MDARYRSGRPLMMKRPLLGLSFVSFVVTAGCHGKQDAPPAPKPTPAAEPPKPTGPARSAGAIGSPLPEAGPHPQYPTPAAAGTDKIFLLEDPDRGPRAPLDFKLPRGRMAVSNHGHCEDDALSIVCSDAPAKAAQAFWRVRRKGKETVVAHQFAPDGKRVEKTIVYLAKPDGTPLQRVELDRYGRVTSALFFLASGGRYTGRARDGSNLLAGCGSMSFKLDGHGRIAERGCKQWLGEPMHDTNGVGITRYERDARGFITGEAHFGIDGEPIANTDGVHRVVYELDADGRAAAWRYRDVGGKPVASKKGCHGYRTDRDDRGAVVRLTCLGADDKPATAVQGKAIDAYVNDARGCRIKVRYLDPHGFPATNLERVHGRDYEVDSTCARKSETCLGVLRDARSCGPGQPARYVYKRNAVGQVVSTKHYDADGEPSRDASYNVFELRSRYDDAGNEIRMSCHDERGQPARCGSTDFAALATKYDDVGRPTEERFFDTDGKATTNLDSWARRFRYDNYDHEFESTSYDAQDQPVNSLGSATRRDLYDAAHRRFGVVLLDKAGEPARYTGCYVGAVCPDQPWHAVRIKRRADGSVESNEFFDHTGQLLLVSDCRRVLCFE